MVQFELDIDWPRTIWVLFGLVLAASVLFIFYRFIGTFVFGLFIYYATRRLYRRVRNRVGQPSVAASISLFGLALPAMALLGYTVAIALQELRNFVQGLNGAAENTQIAQLLEIAGPYLELSTIVEDPGSLLADIGGVGTITQTLDSGLAYLGIFATGLLHLFVMFALAFYLLRDGPKFAAWMANFTTNRSALATYMSEVDESFDKVFYGNILNAFITGAIGALVFSLLNQVAPEAVRIPYPALTGLLAGGASLIPIVGMKLVYIPLAGYLAVLAATNGEGWWFVGLFALVTFIVVDVIPDLMVRPYVSGGNLHTGALMFAYILGPLIFGWYGIFLGPIILILVSHFVRIIMPELLSDEPIRGERVDPATVTEPQERDAIPEASTGGDETVQGSD